MNESFYATLKLVTGEEILSEVIFCDENGEQFYILSGAITVEENATVDNEKGVIHSGLTPKKWPLFAPDDLTIVYKDKVVTISELDDYTKKFYDKALVTARITSPIKRRMELPDHSGYLGNTKNIRKDLEDLFNDS